MKYTITYDNDPKFADTKIIWEGICENAKLKRNLPPGRSFAFYVKDKFDQIKGGCSGYIFYGCLYVDLLWIDKSIREQHYGTQLMKDAEKLAYENHCNLMTVNTMDFEALDFYKKLNFIVEFERHGFNNDSIMYYLRKNLK